MRSLLRIGIALACAAWLVASGLAPRASAANPAFSLYLPFIGKPPDTSRIAFVAASLGCPCPLGIMYSDGRIISTFTDIHTVNSPAWSPDGSELIFAGRTTEMTATVGLYRMAADGTGLVHLLTIGAQFSSRIAWSPDGQQIVFDDQANIYRMRPDGSGLTQLTVGAGINNSASWSPDSQRIVFSSNRQGSFQIYVMEQDGSNPQLIGGGAGDAIAPELSPDGARIAFTHVSDTSNYEIAVMNVNGSDVHAIVSNGGSVGAPSWSPDSLRLAYVTIWLHSASVWVINSDGSDAHEINGGFDPAWGPPEQ